MAEKEVVLRPLEIEDIKKRTKMCANKKVQKLMSGEVINKEVKYEEILDWFRNRKKEKDSKQLTIEYRGKYVGDIDLFDINLKQGTAEFIIMIGFEKYWGKGIGTKAIKLLKNYCKNMGLRKLVLEVNKSNKRAFKAYKKNGFEIVDEKNNNKYLMEIDL